MPAPTVVADLVERFHHHLATYKQNSYNEEQLRVEFLNPLFKALGWDVDNEQGYAAAYKEVIHEDALKVSGVTKAPDYAFRIGGVRKFFLEAKKPSVNIKDDIHPAYQLRRYAWSAKLPLSILSDFEEFAVYDCRVKPDKGDAAATARVLYLRYTDYVARWDELAGIFAKDAILKGSFDHYAESHKAKRGTAEVDTAFLAEIERWRELLARNLALRNPGLTPRELNFAVQQTIDRIVFLRICEDRGIEPYGELMGLQNGAQVYPRLVQKFQEADRRYNSGLFHFGDEKAQAGAPDTLTPGLHLDDKVLKDIFKHLYYPDSPYEFSVLPGGILGQVYENFLGKVVRITPGRQVKIEEKPEVRKAGGVVYTPAYIAEYIVGQVLGRLLAGKTVATAAGLRLLDMACGSGIFLITLYQHLLDWHLAQYLADNPERHARGRAPRLYRRQLGDWRLTLEERKRILLAHVYGVDIDPQAVEVTKLSLLLKLLEGEDRQTLSPQLELLPQRILPDLDRNVRCGNALIGPEFYAGQMALLDEEELYRINVFDWRAAFPEVFAQGGFDGIVGNPPYVLLQDDLRDNRQLRYFRTNYSAASFKIDTYHLFIQNAIRLAKIGGFCSMITPANFMTNNNLKVLRSLLLDTCRLIQIVVIDGGVFKGVSVDNAIFVCQVGNGSDYSFDILRVGVSKQELSVVAKSTVSAVQIRSDGYYLFTGSENQRLSEIWARIWAQSMELGQIADVNFGKQLRDRKKYPSDVIRVDSVEQLIKPYRPCYTGSDISRYSLNWGHLACLDDTIAQRGGCWDNTKHDSVFKLLTRQIGQYPAFAVDELGYQCLNTIFMVNVHPAYADYRFVLALVNSALLRAYWLDRFNDRRQTFPKIKGTYLKALPVRTIDFADPADGARHDRMVALVEQMLALHKRRAAAKTPHEQAVLQTQIDATDRQIDRLVYELYGLTEEEIGIVETAK